jgi:hypothetical protein
MRLVLAGLLSLVFLAAGAPVPTMQIVFDPATRVIFAADSPTVRDALQGERNMKFWTRSWTPEPADVDGFEALLPEALLESKRCKPPKCDPSKAYRYHRQYYGGIERGKRMVYLTAVASVTIEGEEERARNWTGKELCAFYGQGDGPPVSGPCGPYQTVFQDWRTRILHIYDGGCTVFRASYSVDDNKIVWSGCNGTA